jgi:hypothetical protein
MMLAKGLFLHKELYVRDPERVSPSPGVEIRGSSRVGELLRRIASSWL